MGGEEEGIQIGVAESLLQGATKQRWVVATSVGEVASEGDLVAFFIAGMDPLDEAVDSQPLLRAGADDGVFRQFGCQDDFLGFGDDLDDAFHGFVWGGGVGRSVLL